MFENSICVACGTAYPEEDKRPDVCIICADDRQYVPVDGQQWTSAESIGRTHSIARRNVANSIVELKIKPSFAIGHRALLVASPSGNMLWDAVPLLDDQTIDFIERLGGLRAIGFSHPHFYSNMKRWASVFNCPVFINADDSRWIVDGGEHVQLWNGEKLELWDDMTLIKVGGHFPGSAVLRLGLATPGGALLCGDTFVISPGRTHVAAQFSYPNRIPLPIAEIKRIRETMRKIQFDTLLGWNETQEIFGNAAVILDESLARYI